MAVVPRSSLRTRVLVVEPDDLVRDAIIRLLSLDCELAVESVASAARSADSEADVVVDDLLLRELAHLPVADFIAAIKNLAGSGVAAARHLRSVSGAREIRELLSDRELQVVRLVAEGLSNKQISIRLELSDKTVKNHISHILAKMHLSARTQVAVHALRAGIV